MKEEIFRNITLLALPGSDRDGFTFELSFQHDELGNKSVEVFISGTNAELLCQQLFKLGYIEVNKDPKKWENFLATILVKSSLLFGKNTIDELGRMVEMTIDGKNPPLGLTGLEWNYFGPDRVVLTKPDEFIIQGP